jgi:hypothetical protein
MGEAKCTTSYLITHRSTPFSAPQSEPCPVATQYLDGSATESYLELRCYFVEVGIEVTCSYEAPPTMKRPPQNDAAKRETAL